MKKKILITRFFFQKLPFEDLTQASLLEINNFISGSKYYHLIPKRLDKKMDNKNNKIYDLYVDNFQSKNHPIHWMEIKNKTDKKVLLIIPYSPRVHIQNFKHAIYKQYIPLPHSSVDYILKSINVLYNDNIIFSKTFLNEIEKLSDYAIIQLKINYDLTQDNFTYSHLYFLNCLSNKFGSIEATDCTMIITTNKNEIFKTLDNYKESWKNSSVNNGKITCRRIN